MSIAVEVAVTCPCCGAEVEIVSGEVALHADRCALPRGILWACLASGRPINSVAQWSETLRTMRTKGSCRVILKQGQVNVMRYVIEEYARKDARQLLANGASFAPMEYLCVGQKAAEGATTLSELTLPVLLVMARTSVAMAVREETGIDVKEVEGTQVQALQLQYVERLAHELRESLEERIDKMRDAQRREE